MMKPLKGFLVLDFSQFLAGPSASLRLADLGARVIKIERKGVVDNCRDIELAELNIQNGNITFQTLNRNKESYAADLRDPKDLAKVHQLIASADVMIHNFRSRTSTSLGLDYEAVQLINPEIIYASVSGYGSKGSWKDKPSQDLLIQALSGLLHLNGNADQPPMPFPLALPDHLAGAHLVQGILACLVQKSMSNVGAQVEVSLLESALDFQFEVLTTYLNDGGKVPRRSAINNAHAYLSAPYGIYQTADGYLALAMGSIVTLSELLECPSLLLYQDPESWFDERDNIKSILVQHLSKRTTSEWLESLEPADYWCAAVLRWDELIAHVGFGCLDIIEKLRRDDGTELHTVRCPLTIDGSRLTGSKPAPKLGENNLLIDQDFALQE